MNYIYWVRVRAEARPVKEAGGGGTGGAGRVAADRNY
jgi:hypothetical protein